MRDNRGNAKRYYERHKNEDVYKAYKKEYARKYHLRFKDSESYKQYKREYARKHYLKRKATLQRKTENG